MSVDEAIAIVTKKLADHIDAKVLAMIRTQDVVPSADFGGVIDRHTQQVVV